MDGVLRGRRLLAVVREKELLQRRFAAEQLMHPRRDERIEQRLDRTDHLTADVHLGDRGELRTCQFSTGSFAQPGAGFPDIPSNAYTTSRALIDKLALIEAATVDCDNDEKTCRRRDPRSRTPAHALAASPARA